MVPAIYVALKALPLSPNGKLDRSVLPDTAELRPEGEVGYVAPRDELERDIAQIWEEVLDVRPVGIRDDFFALGGQSFSALRLLVRLQQRFHRRLELASVLRDRTVEQLAGLLRESAPPPSAWTPLVPISVTGTKRPLLLVHPAGGNVLCYAELARRLGPDQPVYGVQAAGLSGDAPPATRVEEMAQQYIEAVQGAQLRGPYLLGGWSSGGVVAYEMARRLEGLGQKVEAVLLLDSPSPMQHEAVEDAMLVRWFLEDLAVGFPIDRLSMDALRRAPSDEQLDLALDQVGDAGRLPPGIDRERLRAILGVFKGVIRATRSYDPRPIASRLFVLRASENRVEEFAGHPAGDAPDWGWSSVGATVIEAAPAPGNHHTMLTSPNVAAVAALIRSFLEGLRG
jgi:thioesterase domain-containing protein/acyl carrier protein